MGAFKGTLNRMLLCHKWLDKWVSFGIQKCLKIALSHPGFERKWKTVHNSQFTTFTQIMTNIAHIVVSLLEVRRVPHSWLCSWRKMTLSRCTLWVSDKPNCWWSLGKLLGYRVMKCLACSNTWYPKCNVWRGKIWDNYGKLWCKWM
jgi:hypothetical protein